MAFKRDYVKFNASLAGGTQVVNHGLGEIPKCIVFFYGSHQYGSVDENVFQQARLDCAIGIGATDGTTQFAVANGIMGTSSQIGSARAFDDDKIFKAIYGFNSSVQSEASFVSWDTTSFTIDWGFNSPEQDLPIIAMVLGGNGFEARCSLHLAAIGQAAQTFSFSGNPFVPKGGMCFMAGGHNLLDGVSSSGALGIGHWSENGVGGFRNFSQAFFMQRASANTMSWAADDDESLVAVGSTGTKDLAGHVDGANSGSVDVTFTTIPTETYAIALIHFGGEDLVVSAGVFSPSGLNYDVSPIPLQKPRCIFAASVSRIALDNSTVSAEATGMSIGMGDTISAEQGVVMLQRSFDTSSGGISHYVSDLDLIVSDENSDQLVDYVADGSLALDAVADTETFFRVDTTGTINYVFYLSLGEVAITIVPKAVSGASLNSGNITTRDVLSNGISGLSASIGDISTRILDTINSTVSGVSSSEGDISRTIDYRRTVGHDTASTGELISVVKGGIQIKVDRIKQLPADLKLGLGDETGFNNILTNSPVIEHLHPDEKVKNLKVKYRKNNRENDVYLHEIERSSSSNGVDQTINLPFVYDHDTADRLLDYKRKRFAAAVKRMSLEVGQDAVNANRSDLATVDIPSLGVSSSWEVTGTNVTPAGSQNLSLVPYSELPYNYVSFVSEGGTLPIDTGFDIPVDLSNTPPEPITDVGISYQNDIDDQGRFQTFAVISFNPPDENFSEVRASIRKNGESNWEGAGSGEDRIRIPVVRGQRYDYQLVPYSESNISGLPDTSLTNRLVPGDTTRPGTVTGVTSRVKFNKATWQWNPRTESDLKGYKYEIRTSSGGGSLIRSGFTEDTKLEFDLTSGSLTTSVTRYLWVKAVDYSGNESLNWSSSSRADSNDIKTGDIGTGEIKTGNIGGSQVTNAKLGNISADKITLLGTLYCRNNETAIEVTDGGRFNLRQGGDINMYAGQNDFSFINYRNSQGNILGRIHLNTSGLTFTLESQNAADLDLKAENQLLLQSGTIPGSSGKIVLDPAGDGDIEPQASIIPDKDNEHRIGTNSPLRRWQSVFAVSVNTGDILFDNGYVLTEPDKIYSDQDQDTGLYLMNADYKPIAFFEKNGNVAVAGELFQKVEFEEPHFKAGEVNAPENQEQKQLSERIDEE